jgi:membrane-associated phospholipid phosphatase
VVRAWRWRPRIVRQARAQRHALVLAAFASLVAAAPLVAQTGRDLLRAQISAISCTYGFKFIADRTRPNGDARSFPSAHASSACAAAWTLQTHYGWKLGVPGFVAAGYTAASRFAANKHWASDVVFGAVLGRTSGRTVAIHVRSTKLAFELVAAPRGAAVLVSASR